ncbi:MAG: copper chaperone PCu(A)C [Cocleimonas sp.]
MNIIFPRVVWALALLFVFSGCDNAKQVINVPESITIENAYVRAMPPGQSVTALFLDIKNPSSNDINLVKAKTKASEHIELHEHKQVDGMMQMGQVEEIIIPAGKTVALATGGYHIMLIGLKRDLAIGERVDVTLVFNNGLSKKIQAEVKKQ